MGTVRVAYFIDHLKVGGAQKHLVEVLRHLDRQRFSPQVWTLRGEGELIPAVESLGVPVRSFGLGARLQEMRSLRLFARAVRQLHQERVHIVHCYLSFANVVGTLTAALARVPVLLVSKRSLDSYPRRTEAWGHWAVNRFADRVVANAAAVKEFVVRTEGCPADKIVVISNGINDDLVLNGARERERAALGLGPRDCVVGTLGRLAWKKGHEYFLQAAAEILREEPEVTFVLVGDGPLRQQLEEQAHTLSIASRVKFLGQRLDSQEVISLFDVFVLPSVIEGMPNALLEAMVLERPVVVTNVGGNAEVVTNGETGLVVPPRQPMEMARAVTRLLHDEGLARRLASAGRRAVTQRFCFRHTLHAMETLYEKLLEEKGVRV
ncbi:MAG: glycosyltransferase [Deltaproteobacteria bacterium]|nr:glycosyltransferase [Deltaproteobacteria bacterium]